MCTIKLKGKVKKPFKIFTCSCNLTYSDEESISDFCRFDCSSKFWAFAWLNWSWVAMSVNLVSVLCSTLYLRKKIWIIKFSLYRKGTARHSYWYKSSTIQLIQSVPEKMSLGTYLLSWWLEGTPFKNSSLSQFYFPGLFPLFLIHT